MKKKFVLCWIAAFALVPLNKIISQSCNGSFYQNIYTNLNDFVKVGTLTTISANNVLNYSGSGTGPQRIYRNIGLLSDASWVADCKFYIDPLFPPAITTNHYIMAMTNGTGDPDTYANPNAIYAFVNGTSVKVKSRKGTSFNVSGGINLSRGTQYYIRLQRLSVDKVMLSVFTNSNMTIHAPGSPICTPLATSGTSKITGLRYFHQGIINNSSVNVVARIDDLKICNSYSYAGPDITICPNKPCSLSPTIGGGIPLSGYTYAWSPSTGLSNPNIFNPQVCNLNSTTTYVLTATSINNEYCGFTDEVKVNVLSCSFDQNARFCPQNGWSPAVLGEPALPGVTYQWSPSTGLSCTNCAQPSTSTTGITYTVTKTLSYTIGINDPPYIVSCSCNGTWVAIADYNLCTGIVNPPDGTDMNYLKNQVTVFPNPGNGQLTISGSFNTEDKILLSVYDLSGKKLNEQELQGGNVKQEVNLNLTNGIYFYRISVNGEIVKTDKLSIIQ